VICRIPNAWQIYWFNTDGKILRTITINNQKIPAEKNATISIEKIIPGLANNNLYIQITYYNEMIDPSTNTKTGITELYSYIYTFNMDSETFDKYVKIPDPGKRQYYTNEGEMEISAPPFEFLGITSQEYYYLIRPYEDNKYQMTILNSAGKKHMSRYLVIEDYDLYFKQINITQKGLIYALLCFNNKVDIVWWRSDKLTGESEDEDR